MRRRSSSRHDPVVVPSTKLYDSASRMLSIEGSSAPSEKESRTSTPCVRVSVRSVLTVTWPSSRTARQAGSTVVWKTPIGYTCWTTGTVPRGARGVLRNDFTAAPRH
jgi:hypothetical protein